MKTLRNIFGILSISAFMLSCSSGTGMTTDPDDLMSDTWVATDALGREMPQIDSVGFTKDDQRRVVGMF